MAGQPALPSLVVVTVAVAVYWNALQCGFVFDDISAIKDNKDLRPHTPLSNLFFNDFWGTLMTKEQSHKSYRPLTVLTFRLNYFLHQLEPLGYHATNVVLHAAVCLLYLRLCFLFLVPSAAFLAALLFAVHPIHTEAVTGVVGRAELLSAAFSLVAFLIYSRSIGRSGRTGWGGIGATILLVTCAMLCKEQGITVVGVCLVYDICIVNKLCGEQLIRAIKASLSGAKEGSGSTSNGHATGSRPLHLAAAAAHCCLKRSFMPRAVALAFSTLALLGARVYVMGSQLPVFTRFDNPASASPFPSRQLTYQYLAALNGWLLTFPSALCCDWTMGTVALVESLMDPRNLATLAFYILIGRVAWTAFIQGEPTVVMAFTWMALPFLPASNLFFPVGFVVAERVLYIPSMGFCMLVAHGWSRLARSQSSSGWKRVLHVSFLLLLAVQSIKTYVRNFDWESEQSIFSAGLRVNQRNAKLFNNVGHALESQARYTEALEYFLQAVRVQDDDIGAHINVGRTYNNLGRFKEAEDAYLKAKSLLPRAKPGESYQARIAPNHLNVFLNLANLIARNETRLGEADALYRQAISMRADYTQAYINRGDILIKMNRTKEAQEVYEKALFYDRNNPDIYYNLGVVLLEQGKPSQALAYLERALELEPDHQASLLNSAIVLQEMAASNGHDDATSADSGDRNANAEVIQWRRREATKRLKRLLQLDPNNDRALFNLGMLAMDDGDMASAEHYFKGSVLLKANFRSALFNLALLLSDTGRPLEAVPFLKQLVLHHPDHIKGLILLGDIYINSMKDLEAAEGCYTRILELDPMNVQGQHNLCVVHVERGDLSAAEKCLQQAHRLAPHEDYIVRHLNIVQNRIAKLKSKQQQQQQQQQRQGAKTTDKKDQQQHL